MAAHDQEPDWREATAYVYRRPVSGRELLPAVGIAVGAGAAAFYLAWLFLQRTPLLPAGTAQAPRPTPPAPPVRPPRPAGRSGR